jgi:hypothetical protein
MATRKKTSTEPAIPTNAEALKPVAAKAARTRKAVVPESAPAPEKKTPAKSSAATHKASARKAPVAEVKAPVQAPVKAAPVQAVKSVAPAFDVAAHHEEIAKEAYHHWQRRGCPGGSPEHDWLNAVEIVRLRHAR